MTRIGRVRSSSGEDGRSEFPEVAETVALTFCTKDSAGVLGMADGSTMPDMVSGNRSISDRYRQSEIRGRCNGETPTPRSISTGSSEGQHGRNVYVLERIVITRSTAPVNYISWKAKVLGPERRWGERDAFRLTQPIPRYLGN